MPPMSPATIPNIKSAVAQPRCPTDRAPTTHIIPIIKPIIPLPNAPNANIGEKNASKGDDTIAIKLNSILNIPPINAKI